MTSTDYPIDLRAERPQVSSRGWAALTILLIKFFALIPHYFLLFFLDIAQVLVAFVAQFAVAIYGEYPQGMFDFVTGVLRWNTRVSAFLFSLNDRYPPFTLKPDDTYPVDVVIERPESSSRVYALFTVLVQIVAVIAAIALALLVFHYAEDISAALDSTSSQSWSTDGTSLVSDSSSNTWSDISSNLNVPSSSSTGLLLRQLAALPHLIILWFLALAAFFVWLIVQWVILFTASYPQGLFDFVVGYMRWQVRVTAYALGLSDRYPPFTFDPSLTVMTGATAMTMPMMSMPVATAPASPYTPAAPAVPTTAPPQWYPDPSGQHEYRYWDGTKWTPYVGDQGQTRFDPLT